MNGMTKDELKTIEAKVEYLLEKYPHTRDSDKALLTNLYVMFYKVNIFDSFTDILFNDELPTYDTVSRARRKVQERREDLRAKDKVEAQRIADQEAYIEYALEV